MNELDIRTICFNWMAYIGWTRTADDIRERGGALVTGFKLKDLKKTDKCITAEELWDNYEYFIKVSRNLFFIRVYFRKTWHRNSSRNTTPLPSPFHGLRAIVWGLPRIYPGKSYDSSLDYHTQQPCRYPTLTDWYSVKGTGPGTSA